MERHETALQILGVHLKGAEATLRAVHDEIELREAHLTLDRELGHPEDTDEAKKLAKAQRDLPVVEEKVEQLKASVDALVLERDGFE